MYRQSLGCDPDSLLVTTVKWSPRVLATLMKMTKSCKEGTAAKLRRSGREVEDRKLSASKDFSLWNLH